MLIDGLVRQVEAEVGAFYKGKKHSVASIVLQWSIELGASDILGQAGGPEGEQPQDSACRVKCHE